MVRADVAKRKVARASARLDDVESILARPSEELAEDFKSGDLAIFYLFLAIQECVDLAAHWVVDDGLKTPDDAASTFDVLADHNRIDRETADIMRAATGLRNRIAHGYADLDRARVYDEATSSLNSLRKFLLAVVEATDPGA